MKFDDGCNEWTVKNGKKISGTEKTCVVKTAATCIKEKAKSECAVWFTGCNFCYIDRKGRETCSQNECVVEDKPFCFKEREPFVDKLAKIVAKIDINDKESFKKVYKLAPPPTAFNA